jgi:hypothetical protein
MRTLRWIVGALVASTLGCATVTFEPLNAESHAAKESLEEVQIQREGPLPPGAKVIGTIRIDFAGPWDLLSAGRDNGCDLVSSIRWQGHSTLVATCYVFSDPSLPAAPTQGAR